MPVSSCANDNDTSLATGTPKKWRVGILVNSYRRSTGLAAGGHVHFIEVARRWSDVDVTLFAPEEAREDLLAALPQARFVAIPQVRTPHWRLDQIARMFGGLLINAELRSMDAILCTSHFIADVGAAVAARPSRTVVTLHHLFAPPWKREGAAIENCVAWLSQLFSLLLAKMFVRRFIFVCRYVAETAATWTAGGTSYISTNGVSETAERTDSLEGRVGGIYLGRLDPAKRVEDAIVAWSRLSAGCNDQPLHIVGDGPAAYRERLEALCGTLGLKDRVVFHGRVDEIRKWQLLREAAVYLFPSGEEGWGISVAEAMWAGLPCVTYDLPVYRDLFTQGRLAVDVGDVSGLAAACSRLLLDEPARLKFARQALDLSQTFSWDRAAEIERGALTF